MTRALLVVDMQNDFMPGGALGVHGGDAIIPTINVLMSEVPLVVVSLDWHPEGHVSFSHWPPHCVADTPGAALVKTLDREQINKYVYKGSDVEKDNYSAFGDTDLDTYLRSQNVIELFVVGLTTEYCVKYSVLDALQRGFEVSVIKEACRPAHPHDEQKALDEMQKAGAKII